MEIHFEIENNCLLNCRHCSSYASVNGKERTYLLNIENFSEFLEIERKSSINEKDIIEYGGIQMFQQKKRKYFTYETKELIDRYIEEKGVQVQW